MFYCCGLTECGVPIGNEDSFLIGKALISEQAHKSHEALFDAPFLVALADGVGGEKGGETASRTVLEDLAGFVPSKKQGIEQKLLSVHEKVKKQGEKKGLEGMQSTVCVLCGDGKVLYAANCGDSKIFRFNCGDMEQISTDHSLTGLLRTQGKLSGAEARSHSHKNLILPVLGNTKEKPLISAVCIEEGLKNGDLYFMCSDGVTDVLDTAEISRILSMPKRLSKRLEIITETALSRGGRDNMTVMGLCFA
ncbi:MAG: serine/threonine-protein phosphatase [Oribacterium sp.]|nr:serine/threonine-protein phosphatase [Oribacterium sp.]MBQ5330715.1 serine/threonine-protein phosphatase [Oscillospiraceae bacterium]